VNVEVLFLGTGGAFSAGRRNNLALLIESSGFCMLVEAGPMIMQQLARANLEADHIERLFVSHAHGDHVLGFPMLLLNRMGAPAPLHVYASVGTCASLRALWDLVYPGFAPSRLNVRWHELSERGSDRSRVGDAASLPSVWGGDVGERSSHVVLRTVIVPHPPDTPTLAARWDFAGGTSITFATDTFPNAATVKLAQGSDLLVHEASFSAVLQPDTDPGEHFHSTAQQAGEIARQAECPCLALVHLGPQIGTQPELLVEEARADTDLQVIVPEDGERIRV